MQLRRRKRRGAVRETIATLSLGLVAAGVAGATNAKAGIFTDNNFNVATGLPNLPYAEFDGALLLYQEAGGRVQATEPTVDMILHGRDGRQLSLEFTADTVTGATPNGATPSDTVQTFITPLKAVGSSVTVTSASGGSTVIQLPPTPGQIAAAALGRQYTTAPNTLPVDRGFYDERKAGNFSWSQPLGADNTIGFGGGYSHERDYRSITANVNFARDFNMNNTTLSLTFNFEDDSSFPYGGVPTPLVQMTGQWKSPSSRGKTQAYLLFGITEVVTRRWLMQLNYSYSQSNGYLNDPYRVISVVDQTTGEPLQYLYEARPNARTQQSVYWDNKFDYGPSVTDASLRYYTDSWGLKAETAELSDRIAITHWLSVEPDVRWYRQSAASFFHNYLVSSDVLPAYASSDSRLGTFSSLTYGAQIGVNLTNAIEFYVRGQYYQQTGNGHPTDAIGQLKNQNLFAGVDASSVILGITWTIQ